MIALHTMLPAVDAFSHSRAPEINPYSLDKKGFRGQGF
jgi:hypothetical protein